jgi:glycosyltransferase involved in cell wall biosynthesis
LAAALAARQNSARFVLTEHNLYTRDTINYMLDRSMAERIRRSDWQTFEVTAAQRAWMAWLTEMATVTYEAADELTYLYPDALDEALELGSPVDRAVVIPNGIELHRFAEARLRQAERDALRAEQGHVWRFAYVARVVRIKGLLDLLEALAIFAARDVTDFELSVMGHADETPEYLEACKQRCRELGLEDRVHFLGSQNLMKAFGEVDLVLLPSHNEGQPLVILEAMTAGLPTVGTDVGGMMQLLVDPLSEWGATVGPSGIIIQPHDFEAMADSIQRAVENQVLYRAFRANSVERVRHAFQLHQAMDAYSALYDRLIERTGHPEQVIDLTDATSALWADPGWELARASPADGLAPDLAGIAGPHSTPFDAGPGD